MLLRKAVFVQLLRAPFFLDEEQVSSSRKMERYLKIQRLRRHTAHSVVTGSAIIDFEFLAKTNYGHDRIFSEEIFLVL